MSGKTITTRPATMADFDSIVAFNRAMAFESERKKLDPATIADGVRNALRERTRCMYFMAEIDGIVAGQTMVTFEWSDWRNGFFWWIQSVYVDSRFRRRGVFRAIHAYIRDHAKSRPDVCGLRLYVHRDNTRAIETYKELGMSLTGYLLCEEHWSERGQ